MDHREGPPRDMRETLEIREVHEVRLEMREVIEIRKTNDVGDARDTFQNQAENQHRIQHRE